MSVCLILFLAICGFGWCVRRTRTSGDLEWMPPSAPEAPRRNASILA